MAKFTVVSGDGCAACVTYKTKLKDAGVKFDEVDAYTDEGLDLLANAGSRGIPVIMIQQEDETVFLFGNTLPKIADYI